MKKEKEKKKAPEDRQEATASLAGAKEISVGVSVAAVVLPVLNFFLFVFSKSLAKCPCSSCFSKLSLTGINISRKHVF